MRFDLSGWNPASGDRDLVLGSLKFHANLTFAQRRVQWPEPDRMTQEFKLALASSFVGLPVCLKQVAPGLVGSTPHQ
jgi:hypothetical protein